MATAAQARRIALTLAGTVSSTTDLAFAVEVKGKLKGYAWSWKERIEAKKPRVPNLGVLAIRVSNTGQKALMIAAEPEKFFTEPHYNGYPAVLVRLAKVRVAEIRVLLEEAWRITAAPRRR